MNKENASKLWKNNSRNQTLFTALEVHTNPTLANTRYNQNSAIEYMKNVL